MYPNNLKTDIDLLLCPMDDQGVSIAFDHLQLLRAKQVSVDMYPEPAKLKKQLKYVNARNIRFAGIIGSQEIEEGVILLKDMQEGNQIKMTIDDVIEKLKM